MKKVSKETYNKARNQYNNNLNEPFEDYDIGNIGFLASYNGRFFDGGYAKSGYEKTKNGERYRDYYKESKENLLKQSKNLKDIEFVCCDYKEWLNKNIKNFLIYCDPPYKNTKKYDNSKNFNYKKYWNIIKILSKNNIVIISEQNAPNDFKCIWEKEVSRSIKANDKSFSTEKLFICE